MGIMKTKNETQVSVTKFDHGVTELTDNKHFVILWMKKGFKSITIDFDHFDVQAGSIYFIIPGRTIRPEYCSQPAGWILKFTRKVFNEQLKENLVIKDVDLLSSLGHTPNMILSPKIGDRVHTITEMIDELSGSRIPNREYAVISLLKALLIYCDSKCNIRISQKNYSNSVKIVTRYKELVAEHYSTHHKVSDYAQMMNISTKYLSQVVKEVLDVTAKSVIDEQLVIHARRDLKFSNDSVKEIAFRLGFSDPFHFSNYFKRQMGSSPSEYRVI